MKDSRRNEQQIKTCSLLYVRISDMTWMFALFPLLTECQRVDHQIFTSHASEGSSVPPFGMTMCLPRHERTLDNRCHSYWAKFLTKLSCSTDGHAEQFVFCAQRESWREGNSCRYTDLKGLQHTSAIVKCLDWFERSDINSIPEIGRNLELVLRVPGVIHVELQS